MSDNPRPQQADLTPLAEDLTKSQILARREAAAVEHRWLAANADDTEARTSRIIELYEFVSAADAKLRNIVAGEAAMTLPEVPDVEPKAAPEVVEPEAEAPAAPEVVVEPAAPAAPADDAQSGDDEGGEPAIAEMSDDDIANAMAALESELSSRNDGEGTGVETSLEPVAASASWLAAAGSGQWNRVAIEGTSSPARMGEQMLGLSKMGHMMPGSAPVRYNIGRFDRSGGKDVARLSNDQDRNTHLLLHSDAEERGSDVVAAAADLSICGTPTEVMVDGCELDSSTPFMEAVAGNSIGADQDCIVRWRRPYAVSDLDPAPQLWTPSDQAAVDPADRSTWKPISTQLPPCQDYCTAQPFDTIMGLDVTVNDMTCRPEQIEEMLRWLEVFHAILLEQTAMSIFDRQVGPEHHFAFDAASLNVAEPDNIPQLGAWVALEYMFAALTSRVGIDRHTPMQGWGVAVHPSILKTLNLDASAAGENGDARTRFLEMARKYGVDEVTWTKDFGSCEGIIAAPYSQNAFLCNLEAADIPSYQNGGVGCVNFGEGNALPSLVSDGRMRFYQSKNWWHGDTMMVDFAMHTSAELVRQNRAEFFGERRDFFFKTSNCHSLEFVVDVTGLCPTGQRVSHRGVMPCDVAAPAGAGTPPLAAQISGAGQPAPLQLPDTADSDPSTVPPRAGIGGVNPAPPTPVED